MAGKRAFTLIELLVVIAIIAVLLAIFIPVTRAARERGQRVVCLSNLRQLTTAWIAYADDHDGKLVSGAAFGRTTGGGIRGMRGRTLEGWAGWAFSHPESRSALLENPNKGALWRYVQDIDVYRCPRAWPGHFITYGVMSGANAGGAEGTYLPQETDDVELVNFGKRVGSTVLKLTRITDIVSPGAGQRAVFIDQGYTSNCFSVPYLYPMWDGDSPPPIHHADGATLSMADGHAEYWKWKGRETVTGLPRARTPPPRVIETLQGGKDYEPKTEDGLYDLQRVQRAAWGRLGYPAEETP